jgi:sporulation protein YlmC with PRC-barrel domain
MNWKFILPLIAGLSIAGAAWGQTDAMPGGDGNAADRPVIPETMDSGASDTEQPAATNDAMQGGSGTEGQFITEQSADQTRAENIVGAKVVNSAGDEIGTISDIILDKDGKISGIVIESGGVFGVGAKRVAISTAKLPSMKEANVLLIGLSPDELKQAPEFKTIEEKKAEQQDQGQRGEPQ